MSKAVAVTLVALAALTGAALLGGWVFLCQRARLFGAEDYICFYLALPTLYSGMLGGTGAYWLRRRHGDGILSAAARWAFAALATMILAAFPLAFRLSGPFPRTDGGDYILLGVSLVVGSAVTALVAAKGRGRESADGDTARGGVDRGPTYLAIASLGLICMGLWACFVYGMFVETFTRPNLRQISRVSEVQFPSSTVLERSIRYSFGHDWVVAKLTMDRSDADGFLRSLPGGGQISETMPKDVAELHAGIPWWHPKFGKCKCYYLRTYESDRAMRTFTVVVGQGDPGRSVVYFERGLYSLRSLF